MSCVRWTLGLDVQLSDYPPGQDNGPLTPDDREFMALSSEQLQDLASQFSFDVNQLVKHMKNKNAWILLIQGHLYIDHILNTMLLDSFVDKDVIAIGRLGFTQRLELAIAFGLISKDLTVVVKKINSVRNRLAHNLDFDVNAVEVRELINTVPSAIRKFDLRNPEVPRKNEISLGELMEMVAVLLDTDRQKAALLRFRERKLRLAAAAFAHSVRKQDGSS